MPGGAAGNAGQPGQADGRCGWGQSPHAAPAPRPGGHALPHRQTATGASGVDFQPTEAGAPQGGPLSPLLANVALHGLEPYLRAAFKNTVRINDQCYQGWKPLLVIYADDFVVLHEDRQVIEQVRQLSAKWLAT